MTRSDTLQKEACVCMWFIWSVGRAEGTTGCSWVESTPVRCSYWSAHEWPSDAWSQPNANDLWWTVYPGLESNPTEGIDMQQTFRLVFNDVEM